MFKINDIIYGRAATLLRWFIHEIRKNFIEISTSSSFFFSGKLSTDTHDGLMLASPEDKECLGNDSPHETKRQLCKDMVILAFLPRVQGACPFLIYTTISSIWKASVFFLWIS
ncbi:hypothetical protein D0469_20115 [Peribacillus saganii]|uniref:Uncharacterized protein n=1 Tax=Peribacillus saganii TaxID=2303992 RepID=A0A372LBJ0_9BACI|nr:hypothetical protein D0469_20115 [Peribacillus saganii]